MSLVDQLVAISGKLGAISGILPPGSEKVVEIARKYPKTTFVVGNVIIIGGLWKYFSRQKYPAPWLDRRVLESKMTKKEILGTDLKPDNIGDDVWDVIVVGSGSSGLVTANFLSRAGLKVSYIFKSFHLTQ